MKNHLNIVHCFFRASLFILLLHVVISTIIFPFDAETYTIPISNIYVFFILVSYVAIYITLYVKATFNKDHSIIGLLSILAASVLFFFSIDIVNYRINVFMPILTLVLVTSLGYFGHQYLLLKQKPQKQKRNR